MLLVELQDDVVELVRITKGIAFFREGFENNLCRFSAFCDQQAFSGHCHIKNLAAILIAEVIDVYKVAAYQIQNYTSLRENVLSSFHTLLYTDVGLRRLGSAQWL